MIVGSIWRWQGEAICVDAPRDLLLLGQPSGEIDVRRRAARSVRRMLGPMVAVDVPAMRSSLDAAVGQNFVVTDGRTSYAGSVIDLPGRDDGLLVFSDNLPPADADLWVVERALSSLAPRPAARLPRGLTCFVAGTAIETPFGPRAVQDLSVGDRVLTRDNGPQPVLWAGHCDVPGTRLADHVALRPIRLSAGAFGPEILDDLLVSPDHRVLIGGTEADVLFGADEVLVAARDLVDWPGVAADHSLDDLRYHHLMFEHHQVVFAGGVPCESFHPADVDLDGLLDAERLAFIAVAPDIYRDAAEYGAPARRCLTQAEAALLNFGFGVRAAS